VVFYSNLVRFKDNSTGEVLLQASSIGNVYPLYLPAERPLVPATLAFSSSGDHWYHHLGYCGAHTRALLKKTPVLNVSPALLDNCMTCRLAKSHRLLFNLVKYRTSFPLELIHSDVW